VEYEETYYGHRIIVTTLQQSTGDWKSKAELLDSGRRSPWVRLGRSVPLGRRSPARGLSVAAGAIDRTRIARGKP